MPRDAVAATGLINIASYNAAYVACLLSALAITAALGRTNPVILVVSAIFAALGIVITTAALAMSGHRARTAGRLARLPLLAGMMSFLEEADPALTRRPKLLLHAALWQLSIFVLDAATILVLIRSLGATASAAGVFASFMISSVFRTLGILPGGLGTFAPHSTASPRGCRGRDLEPR